MCLAYELVVTTYLVKPFAFAELIARVDVLAKRRENSKADDTTSLFAGSLKLDLLSERPRLRDTIIDLQAREFVC